MGLCVPALRGNSWRVLPLSCARVARTTPVLVPAAAPPRRSGAFSARWPMPCEDCRKSGGCRDEADFRRDWLFGRYIHGVDRDCLDHVARWHHGIEGVAA